MKRVLIITLMAAGCAVSAMAQGSDETQTTSGLWQEFSVSKVLPYNWSLDAEAGYRTTNNFSDFDRLNVGLGVNYKLGKYLKFGLGYVFIRKHYLESMEYKYKGDYEFSSFQGTTFTDDEGTDYAYKGYNLDAANWASRHRAFFEVTADKRFWKTLRISLRERYQYTHQMARNVDRTKYRDPSYDATGAITEYDEVTSEVKEKAAWDRHLLRSRLKFSIDKKGWDWEPFVSAELHNNLREKWHIDKIRASAGVEYSVSKTSKIAAAYIFTHENDDDGNENEHSLSVSYRFKF